MDSALLVASLTDPDAFSEFYRRNLDPLLAWLRHRLADPEDAADLAAESFVAAFRRREHFRPELGSGRAWLWGIARCELLRWHRETDVADRAHRRADPRGSTVDDETMARVDALVDLMAIDALLQARVARLPNGEWWALQLRVLDEMSYADVAGRLGCAEGAVRVRVSRALARLRTSLSEVELSSGWTTGIMRPTSDQGDATRHGPGRS